MTRRGIAAALAAAAAVGCRAEESLESGPPPAVLSTAIAPNRHMVVALEVEVRVQGVDSVAVRYRLAGESADSVTPAVAAAAGPIRIPVLGLVAAGDYRIQAIGYRGGSIIEGERLAHPTGSLPADLPRYQASGADPSPGAVIFAVGKYGVAIDNTGRVVWYRRFPDGAGLNFMALPSGRYAARPVTPEPDDLEPWVELDRSGEPIRTFGCARGLGSRPHDLIGEADGGYWIMCDDVRTVDLSRFGGPVDARVTGTAVQRIGPAGELRFEWTPFGRLDLADLDSASLTAPIVNWTHGNALDLDGTGTLVISFRNLSEVTGIDLATGAIRWRLGGSRNQFSFGAGAGPAFARQHGVRVTGGGEILLLDNLGEPVGSRAERYQLDFPARTARLVGAYQPASPVLAQLGGTTQELDSGHTLVSFGSGGRVEEYDRAGRLAWRIDGNPGYLFRAQRIRSLYAPGIGDPR